MFESDYLLTGKHAKIVKAFTADARTFSTFIETYKCAAVFGLLYNTTAPKDKSTADTANILASAFNNHRSDCVFLYRLVMLLEKTTDRSNEERIDRAFRDDADTDHPERLAENMELFNAHVRGGLEVMDQMFLEGCISEDDYLRRAYERFDEFADQIDGSSMDERIAALL